MGQHRRALESNAPACAGAILPASREKMEIEFSLKGLSELLAKYGLRVVAGSEGNNSFIERLEGGSRMIYRVEKIDLTVTQEKPVPESKSGAGCSSTASQGEG
jgi:hypothetical protein